MRKAGHPGTTSGGKGDNKTPPVDFEHIYPFPAQDGGKPTYYLYQGYVAATAPNKAAPERIKELLRIMNWLAAPIGSAEDTLLTCGIKDVHYTVDEKGNPQPSQARLSEGRYVPWQYVVQRPQVIYIADIPGCAEAAVQAEQTLTRRASPIPHLASIRRCKAAAARSAAKRSSKVCGTSSPDDGR